MKIKLRNILITLLALTATVCIAVGLSACGGGVKLTDLTIENNRIEFLIGDEFVLGEGFTVYANYNDGSQLDVTEEVEIKKEVGFDMNVAGDYQITVSYMGKKAVYTVYVGTFNNVLLKIDLNTENVKKQYKLGESISFDNIKITSTFENAQGNEVTAVTTSIKDFTIRIENDESGKTTEEVLQEFGDFTVSIGKGAIRASYKVNVEGVDISTVQGAVTTGAFFKDKIVSGSLVRYSKLTVNNEVQDFNTRYEFGDNYTHVEELKDNPGSYYMSVDDEGFFCLNNQGGKFVPVSSQEVMMNGPRILLWYNGVTEYGAENALLNLYSEAKRASNKDLKETVDEENRTYSFTFSGLVLTNNNRPDYYENEVTFTLSENYSITSLTIKQMEWENDQAMLDSDPNWNVTFRIDPETNITTPNGRASSTINYVINQEEGERVKQNPYKREDFVIQSFDVSYNGEVIEDGAVINCDMNDKQLKLQILNVLPETADFSLDTLFLNYEGSYLSDSQFINFEGLNVYSAGNTLTVTLRNGGVWTILLKTKSVTKSITFNVKGVAPTSMEGKLRNDATGAYYSANSKLISLNGEVYFTGEVNKYANPDQSAVITSDNAANATIEKVVKDGKECFKFTATEKGVYTVKVSSAVAPNVGCTFTFEVGDVPDFENILKGKYTGIDTAKNVLELTFTPSGDGAEISGTFIYTETSPSGEKGTENYSYAVDTDSMTINVEHVSGDDLQITLSVNASGKLVLTDYLGRSYELTPVA